GALDLEGVAVVEVVLDERADDQHVHRHPDRTAPVGISAEHSAVRLGRQIAHAVALTTDVELVRMLEVMARKCADAVRAQELLLIQHAREDASQPLLIDEREDSAARYATVLRAGGVHTIEQLRHALHAAEPRIGESSHGLALPLLDDTG